ncbi:MAG TPA: hypothetical protein VH044_03145 [Polyangiaceae bacterium]|jgi:hypothetical protein|nr:hypothetical protein [Polyangiaceae bacterium]
MGPGSATDLDVTLARVAGKIGLGVWFVAMLALGVTLLARHLVALPAPPNDAQLANAMGSLRTPAEAGRWMAIHVLDAQCGCSRRIADHVMATVRPSDLAEHVLLVGHDAPLEARLARKGMPITEVTEAELVGRYHAQAVPMLLVVAPDGTLPYVGGYTDRKQGPAPRDLEIIEAARAGRDLPALPILGCAVGERLKDSLNPLGVP